MNILKLIGLHFEKVPNPTSDFHLTIREESWEDENWYIIMVKNSIRTIIFVGICLVVMFLAGYFVATRVAMEKQRELTCEDLKPIIERNEAFDVECVTEY